MSNLFRFNILRPVQELPKERLDKIGINTHADGTFSAWAENIFDLCEENDHPAIYNEAVTFLKSSGSVSSYTDKISPLLQEAVEYLRKKGRKLDATDFNRVFTMVKLTPYFTPDPATGLVAYVIDKQAIEDTILALAFLSKLGNKGNINHTLVFRANQLLAFANFKQAQLTQNEIDLIYAKPVVIPYCRYNKCTKKYETTEPFRYLELELLPAEPPPSRGTPDCNCNCEETACQEQNTCCAEIKPYVSDLMIVREDLKRYEAKHLAYIENIMVGEERIREHRNLERTETFSETETETTRSIEKDHQVEDRFSLKSEIEKTLQEDLSIDAGVTTNSEFGTTKLNTNFNFSYDQSKSESSQISQEYARNVMTRSVSKVEEKVRELKSIRRIMETEETNSHKFSNIPGTKHIVGQYHFVNMINRAQVMNYGKRLMFEFVLPEPMELYKKLLEKDVLPFDLEEPVKPPIRIDQVHPGPFIDPNTTPPILTDVYSDNMDSTVSPYYLPNGLFNYLDLVKFYNITGVDPMPDPDIRIPFSFDIPGKVEYENALTFTIDMAQVPEGYNARGFKVEVKAIDNLGDNTMPDFEWFVDGVHSGSFSGFNSQEFFSPPVDAASGSKLTLSAIGKSILGVAGSGYVLCLLSDQAKTKWQTTVWEKIMAKYTQDKEEFETARARYLQEKNAKLPFGNNPFINREIERTELKRLAISYISCQFYEQFSAMKRNTESCGYPEMDLEQAQRDGTFVQFFEQLFQWNLMTYLFYPYFWGQKCSWPEKVQTNSGDPLFDKALAAGAVRVQVPVRPGHEALAVYWSAYGEIWQGQSEPPVPGTDYYLSMVQEIKEQKNHFYNDRPGVLEAEVGQDWVTLSGSGLYWDFTPVMPPLPEPQFPGGQLDQNAIDADIDREILINCAVYRVTGIIEGQYDDTLVPPGYVTNPGHTTWTILLDRPLEGTDCYACDEFPAGHPFNNLKFQMGAVFVGSPFEVVVPTNLVFLRNTKDPVSGEYISSDCLPCYPLDKCE
ncbi:MAG: hypothetical protein FD123_2330 [Bacteroidetes bacterium]|nr:MAG: hypothetical protein FD123_2330 [Bacteroidota bacterium]